MAKQVRVFSGTQWEPLAVTLPDLSNYSTTTQMNTAIDAAKGLVLINTTSISAASSATISNVFSSTYQNYRIVFNVSAASTTLVLSAQLTASGTASTTGWYYGQLGLTTGGSTSNTSGGNQSSYFLMDVISSEANTDGMVIDLLNPNNTVPTVITTSGFFVNSTPVGIVRFGTGQHSPSTAYDGIKINASTGNFTGTVRVYGYRNS